MAESIAKLLECAICSDVLKDPKAFSCLNSFCLCCLENTVEFSNKLVLLHHALNKFELVFKNHKKSSVFGFVLNLVFI